MSPFYRPSQSFSSPHFGVDGPTPATGSSELGKAAFSAGIESQLSSPAEVTRAHSFFQVPVADARVLAAPALVPGGESAAMAMVPGANEPVSPIIQLIMRLPGHIGIMNSFFEALGHLFNPDLSLLGSLDLTHVLEHAQAALASAAGTAGSELTANFSLVPQDSLNLLGHNATSNFTHAAGGADALTGKLSPSAGEHLAKNPLQCSGEYKLSDPHFEGAATHGQAGGGQGPFVSGPEQSSQAQMNYLAGEHRLFNDQFGSKGGLTQASSSPAAGSTQSLPGSLNVGASPLASHAQALPAVARIGDGVMSGPGLSGPAGYHLGSPGRPLVDGGSSLGPSGAVSQQLGEHRLLASHPSSTMGEPVSPPEKGSLLGPGSFDSASLTPVGGEPPASMPTGAGAETAGQAMKGLKATQLTLPGVKVPAPVHARHAFDHLAHQTKPGAVAASGAGIDEVSRGSLLHPAGQGHAAHHAVAARHQASHHEPAHKTARTPGNGQTAEQATHQDKPLACTDSGTPVADAGSTSYTIRAGDCLWNIARDHLGSAARWQEIYKLNAGLLGSNPDLIHTGVTINLPPAGPEIASGAAEGARYVVAPGDNLWNIARDHLGGGQHWKEIYQGNHDLIGANPQLIHPGQELTLPGGAPSQIASSAPAAPALSQAIPQAAPQAVTPAAPLAPDSTAITQPAPAPIASLPASGAAAAATLPQADLTGASAEALAPSSLRPDLSQLLRRRLGK